jgi:cytochrome c-type biogenesis protein CcmH
LAAKRRLQYLVAACWMTILLAAATVVTGASSGKPTLQEVSERLTCQCGCGLTVANCNHPQCEFSVPVRSQIETMISRGMGGEQIVGFFRAKYGEKILSAPTFEGFNVLAWAIPFTTIFAGCFIIVGAIRRWRMNQVTEAEGSAHARVPYDRHLKQQLDDEVREQR